MDSLNLLPNLLNWGFIILWMILLLVELFYLYHWLRFAHSGFLGRLVAYSLFAASFILAFVALTTFFTP